MGLDCYIYESKHSAKEMNIIDYEYNPVEIEIWYGRKTHTLMNYLIPHDYMGNDNCTYISLDYLDIQDLKELYFKESLKLNLFEDRPYELDALNTLIEALLNRDIEKYPYLNFYAWY